MLRDIMLRTFKWLSWTTFLKKYFWDKLSLVNWGRVFWWLTLLVIFDQTTNLVDTTIKWLKHLWHHFCPQGLEPTNLTVCWTSEANKSSCSATTSGATTAPVDWQKFRVPVGESKKTDRNRSRHAFQSNRAACPLVFTLTRRQLAASDEGKAGGHPTDAHWLHREVSIEKVKLGTLRKNIRSFSAQKALNYVSI